MAFSVGNDLAALLAPGGGADSGARKAPANGLPVAELAPDFAGMLAAATAPASTPAPAPEGVEPGLVPWLNSSPAVPPQPRPAATPSARPAAPAQAAMPWETLAAAAEEADALAAAFQWPQQGATAPQPIPNPAELPEATPEGPLKEEEAATLLGTAEPVLQAPLLPAPLPIMAPVVQEAAKNEEIAMPPVVEGPDDAAPPSAMAPSLPTAEAEITPAQKTMVVEAPIAMPEVLPDSRSQASSPSSAVVSAAPVHRVASVKLDGEKFSFPARPADDEQQPSLTAGAFTEESEPFRMEKAPVVERVPTSTTLPGYMLADSQPDQSTTPSAPSPQLATAPTEPARLAEAHRPAAAPLVIRPQQLAQAGHDIVVRASKAAADGVETVSVDLRPPELGRVELRLTFRDGTVQVSLITERAETFEALRQDRANLEQQMQQAGLQLGGGGLDLQHGRLPPRDTGEQTSHALQSAPSEDEGSSEELAAPARRSSDSLIDLIA